MSEFIHLMFQVLLGILTGSFSLGNAIPEIEAFSTALASATIVYEIIDRVSVSVSLRDVALQAMYVDPHLR